MFQEFAAEFELPIHNHNKMFSIDSNLDKKLRIKMNLIENEVGEERKPKKEKKQKPKAEKEQKSGKRWSFKRVLKVLLWPFFGSVSVIASWLISNAIIKQDDKEQFSNQDDQTLWNQSSTTTLIPKGSVDSSIFFLLTVLVVLSLILAAISLSYYMWLWFSKKQHAKKRRNET